MQSVSGSHIAKDNICVFGVILVSTIDHSRPLWSSLDQRRNFALFWGAAFACTIPNTHMLFFAMWLPDTLCTKKLEIHFRKLKNYAMKKLNIWAHAEFQGASVCWPPILLNVKIFIWKIRYPVIFYHIPVTYICAFDNSAQTSDSIRENLDTEAHPPYSIYSVKFLPHMLKSPESKVLPPAKKICNRRAKVRRQGVFISKSSFIME